MPRIFIITSLIAAMLSACGGGEATVAERCSDAARTLCSRLYECVPPEDREQLGFPATEAGCISEFEDEAGCSNATADTFCEGSQIYRGFEHERCIDQVASASCGQIQSDDDFSPACERVCSVE